MNSRFIIGAPTSDAGKTHINCVFVVYIAFIFSTIPHFLSCCCDDAGKTSISLGLQRALFKRGISVQPFKCGPDYLDSKFHELASHTKSYNIDSVMMSEEHIHEVYLPDRGEGRVVSIVEGVMGLFDGARKSEGSTAELSKLLNTPVVLVVDARAVAYSVAPLLHGFKTFDPSINIIGVIFNKVGSPSHYTFLQEACEDVSMQCFGYVPRIMDAEIPSRHLGLSIAKIEQYDSVIEVLANGIEATVDLVALLSATEYTPCESSKVVSIPKEIQQQQMIFAVAKDGAFNFIYSAVIHQLQKRGEVIFFSPLEDDCIPACDLLYLPGGYPECYLEELTSNTSMKTSITSYIDNNGKVLAECGGYMYLGKSIQDVNGKEYEMVGALDITTSMKNRKLHLGYRKIKVEGQEMIGHEFHYSSMMAANESSIGEVTNIRNEEVATKLVKKGGILASYLHFYFGADKDFDVLWKWINL